MQLPEDRHDNDMTHQDKALDPRKTHTTVLAVASTATAASSAIAAEKDQQFLSDINSNDEDVNFAAWSIADQMDPSVIPELSKLLLSTKPNVRKASDEALKRIVHSVGQEINAAGLRANAGRPDDPGKQDRRQQVVTQLLALLQDSYHTTEKTIALRHLSLISTSDDVTDIAALIHVPEVREEAVFCLERIPGKTSEEALLAAYNSADDSFKPRILAALGHRQADEAVGVCIKEMQSTNSEIAMAAMKAWARIGKATGPDVQFPDYDSLTEWQKTEYEDSMLRYADAQFKRGNSMEALAGYSVFLDHEAEHLQCAAIIGLANIGTAEAAAKIFAKLDNPNNTVRITAQKAWARIAREAVD